MSSRRPDLEAAWIDACAEFHKATGYDLTSTSNANSADDIVHTFRVAKAKDAEARETIDKAKTVVRQTLVAVEQLGTIAAQGASMVFGSPANVTMNCISFFINAGFEYKDIAHNIEDLFSRIVTVLERFQIYRENETVIKDPMIRVSHRLLLAIVSICGLCIKRMNGSKIKKYLRVTLFSDDGGIKDQFAILEGLEREELHMAGTMTLVATERSQRMIASGFDKMEAKNSNLIDKLTQMNENNTDRKVLEDLKEKLGTDDRASKEEYGLGCDKLLPGTCSWLQHDSCYKSWSDMTKESHQLLILHGDEGCGKSYTFTAVVRDLRSRYSHYRQDTSRLSVAYCYLTRGGKKGTQHSKSTLSIRDVTREWAWQIANNDVLYRKKILATYKQSLDLTELVDLWRKLFLDHLDEDVNFFLLLDGTHELDERGVKDLESIVQALSYLGTKRGRLRIAITARPSLKQTLVSQSPGNISAVDLRDKSRADIESYVRHKADNLSIFQKSSLKIQKLKSEVCTGLLNAVNGNFIFADLKLKEISTKDDFEEVRQIVGNMKESAGLESSVVEQIRECNRTLTAREMEDLNAILLWIIYGKWSFSIAELEAILFVQHDRASLQPLAKQIKKRFSSFLDVSGDENTPNAKVSLKYDYIADYFKNLSDEQKLSETTTSDTLSKGEIRMAQHFIEKLCDQDIYAKLGFKKFFDQKLSRSEAHINVDCDNAHARLALICLRVITSDVSDERSELTMYAVFFTTDHLKETDLDKTDPRLKAELGPPLLKMFRDSAVMSRYNELSWRGWSYSDIEAEDVLRLLRSSALTSKINTSVADNRQWVDAVLGDSNPGIALLRDSAKGMVRHWLSSENDADVLSSFQWLYGYMNKVHHAEDPEIKRLEYPPPNNKIYASEIQQVLRETKELQPEDLCTSDLSRKRNIAITYSRCGHIPEAIDQFNALLAIDPNYIYAHGGLARAHAEEVSGGPSPNWKQALLHQDIVIDYLESGKQLYPHLEPKKYRKTVLLDKATWLRRLERYNEAHDIYLNMLENDPDDDEVRLQYLFGLCETHEYGAVVEYLDNMNQTSEKSQENRLTRFFHHNADNAAYHTIISRAFKQVDGIFKIQTYYQTAVSAANNSQTSVNFIMRYASCALTYHLAGILWNHGEGASEKEEAIRLWEQVTEPVKTEGISYTIQTLAARRLARIYIAQAVEAGRDSQVANEMLTKVQGFARAPKGETIDDDDEYGAGLSPAQSRSLLGRYFTRVGDVEEARKLLRTDVDIGLKLLSDDDVTNDFQGYWKLGYALMNFGDDNNAIAAWSLIQPTEGVLQYRSLLKLTEGSAPAQNSNEAGKEPESHIDAAKRFLDGPLNCLCDGDCRKMWSYVDDIYVCRECIDVQFDLQCIEKLRRGELPCDVCDKNHMFLHIPAWSLEATERAQAGKVLVGGRVLDMKEWQEGIKKEWGLLEPKMGEVATVGANTVKET